MSNFVVAGRMCLFLVALVSAALARASTSDATDSTEGSEWLSETSAGVLEMLLVHREPRSADGGVLHVDPYRRVVTWEGIPGERGCRQRLEAPFGNVRAVRDEPVGLVRLEIKGQPRDRWMFVPLPHAAWLVHPASALSGGMSKEVADSLVGPDGFPLPVGGSAVFSGVQLRAGVVPGEVAGDVRLAVERIREVLGRTPAPSVELHEALSGRPIEVPVADLLASPGPLEGRAVRVRGVVELLPNRQGLAIDDDGSRLRVLPQPEIADVVASLVPDWKGQEVEVAGVFRRRAASATDEPSHELVFWEYLGPETASSTAEVRTATIQDLVQRPTDFAGQAVRVVGRFRGHDVDRSLPPRPRGAWAIKAGRHAIWVTGHKPSGRGFTLHPELEADTHKWLEVVGRLEVQDGVFRLRASAVGLSAPASSVRLGKRLVGTLQPEVVFTLPLADGEPVATNARFLVQFNAYMDEETFEGRVRLRYADVPGPPGDLGRMRFTYDDVRRTLIVEPGEPLRTGATVELLLLPGITDAFATPLASSAGADAAGAPRLLRWQVEGSLGQPAPHVSVTAPGPS
jgi:hypothetical protein